MTFYIYDEKGFPMQYVPGAMLKDGANLPAPPPPVEKEGPLFSKDKIETTTEIATAQTFAFKPLSGPAPISADKIMKFPVISASPEMNLEEASEIFNSKDISYLPILSKDENLVGMVCHRNMLVYLYKEAKENPFTAKGSQTQVKTVMWKNILAARPDVSINLIAKVFIERNVGAIPILDSNNKLCGIITRKDILQAMIKFYS